MSLVLWVVGAIISWFGLAISLEYGCMLPRSGGQKVYLEFTYRRPRFLASTLVATQAVLLGFTASNCIVFGEYVLFALYKEPNAFAQKILAVGLLTAITVAHGCFLKTGIVIQNVLGWVKIGLILFMVLTSLFVVILRPDENLARFSHRQFNQCLGTACGKDLSGIGESSLLPCSKSSTPTLDFRMLTMC
jgi:amino acid transporter